MKIGRIFHQGSVGLDIDSSHNVDIPNGNLDVNGTITSTAADDAKLKLYTASGQNKNRIEYLTSAGATRSYLGYSGATSFLYYHDTDSVEIQGGTMLFNSSGIVTIESGGTNAIVANTSQNVSIPNGYFSVSGDESYPVRIQNDRQNTAYTFVDSTGATVRAALGYGQVSSTDSFNIQNNENSPMRLYTNSQERVQITAGGNVGIGETSPQVKLHASGSGEIARLETSAGTGDNYFTFHDTAQKGLVGYESGSDNLVIENGEIGSSIIFKTAHTGAGGATYNGLELDGDGDVTMAGVLTATGGIVSNGSLEVSSTIHALQLSRWTSLQQVTNLSSYGTVEQGEMWFNSSSGDFLGWDGSAVVNLGDAPRGETTVKTIPSNADVNLFSDSNLDLFWDVSGSDIELDVKTNPATSRVHAIYVKDGTTSAFDVLVSSGNTVLDTSFSNDDACEITINAPSDSAYPSSRFIIKKSNSFYHTNAPFYVIATKYP